MLENLNLSLYAPYQYRRGNSQPISSGHRSAKRPSLTLGMIFSLSSLYFAACTTVGPKGSVRQHYFGYTVVKEPMERSSRDTQHAKEVTNIGFVIGSYGLSIGYTKEQIIALPLTNGFLLKYEAGKTNRQTKWLSKKSSKVK